MSGFSLRPASIHDDKKVWDMLQAIPREENGFWNAGHGIPYEEFREFLVSIIRIANGIGLEDWQVPQITYWLYKGETPVGISKLRLRLTEGLLKNGGNIGFGILPSERRKGYGKILLNLTLAKARAKGMDMVLLTCNDDNPGSWKIIEHNNGKLEKTEDNHRYYWIYL
ncbi:MAG: GNAT family N-acetyltransferase [Spirochaetales bacterium]|nr:GNAT family N-acetyltransferase [Spirochaetales bacterium]